MSRNKRHGLKKTGLILCIALLFSLGLLGISQGAWNDLLESSFTVNTAEFEPQIEVYKIVRERGNRVFDCFEPVTPNQDGVLTVRIGRSSDDPVPSLFPAFLDDRFRIYFRVINKSSIPVDYRVDTSNLTNQQKEYVSVSPGDWKSVGAKGSADEQADGNYIDIELKYQPEISITLPNGQKIILQKGINPFDLIWGEHLDKILATVKFKQFNSDSGDSGWAKDVKIRIFTNDLYGF